MLPVTEETSGTKRWTAAALAAAFPMVNQSTRRRSTQSFVLGRQRDFVSQGSTKNVCNAPLENSFDNSMIERDEIDREVDRILCGNKKRGLREHMIAFLQFTNGYAVDARCPDCRSLLSVKPFPANNGYAFATTGRS